MDKKIQNIHGLEMVSIAHWIQVAKALKQITDDFRYYNGMTDVGSGFTETVVTERDVGKTMIDFLSETLGWLQELGQLHYFETQNQSSRQTDQSFHHEAGDGTWGPPLFESSYKGTNRKGINMTDIRTCVKCGVEYDASLFFVTLVGFPCHSELCQDCAKKDTRIGEVIPYTEEAFKEMGRNVDEV